VQLLFLVYHRLCTPGHQLLLQTFLNEAVDGSTEGLIVKTLGDSYEPSKRSSHWLKLKKDYLEGVGDTFDLVPIGAFFGKGKRAGEQHGHTFEIYRFS
jgi:DNA ligase-1